MADAEMQYRLWPFWTMPSEIDKITRSMLLCVRGHEGQMRKYSGMPYWTHPFRVATALASYPQAKLSWICAGYMHDLLEDTSITEKEIKEASSEEALQLVKEMTNVSKKMDGGKLLPRRERKKQDWERLKGISKGGKVLKMHDRIDNLREMLNAPVSFKKLYCEESKALLEVVRDGDKNIAFQLEDAIKFIYKWRFFPAAEMQAKPVGTLFEHAKYGECWIAETGPEGRLQFASGISSKFEEGDGSILSSLMQETGESK